MNLTKEEFIEKYAISDQRFQDAGISWDELQEIYEDYNSNQLPELEKIRDNFMASFLTGRENELKIRSFASRCKNGEHLIAKIIRRKVDNFSKYRNLNKDNYMKFITDTIGIRGLLLYREDWTVFHKYLLENFSNDSKDYIKDCLIDFNEDSCFSYIAEPPKVHIRLGDYDSMYHRLISPDNIESNKHYRAIHYIIKYHGVYLEIQVKTLFEEGWGEVDHHIRYPNRTNDKLLEEFSELLNRVSGLGDEMASFYNRLECVPSSEFITRKAQLENDTEILEPQPKNNSVAADSETLDQMIAAVVSE